VAIGKIEDAGIDRVLIPRVDQSTRLRFLRNWQRLLDNAFRIPGTTIRFGWDPIVGLIPWAGDLVTALFACVLIAHAHQMRLPKVVQLRMLMNVGIDVLVGVVPLFGDVADLFWKANTRNLALIERHAANPRPATPGDWLFVAAVSAAIVLVALVPLAVMYWLLHDVLHRPLV
jgi:hypothetical protein